MRLFEGAHALSEMRHLPEGHYEIEHAQTRHSSAHPPGSEDVAYGGHVGLLRRIDEEEVVAPVAYHFERTHPRQQRKYRAHLKTESDVEDDCKPCRHKGP